MRTLFELHDRLLHFAQSTLGVGANAKHLESSALLAALDAFQSLYYQYRWKYYWSKTYCDSPAPSAVNFTYVASTNTITLTSGTVPDWWADSLFYAQTLQQSNSAGYLLEPIEKVSNTEFKVKPTEREFASDVSTAAAGKFYRGQIPIPSDAGAIVAFRSLQPDRYLDLMSVTQASYLGSVRRTLDSDPEVVGIRQDGDSSYFVFDVMPGTARTYEVIYYRAPKFANLVLKRKEDQRITVASTTATLDRLSVPSTSVGDYLIVSEDTTIPTTIPILDGSSITHQLEITARGSATSVTVASNTITDKAVVLSSKLDIAEYMWLALQRLAEFELGRRLGTKDLGNYQAIAKRERDYAQVQDSSLEQREVPPDRVFWMELSNYGGLAFARY